MIGNLKKLVRIPLIVLPAMIFPAGPCARADGPAQTELVIEFFGGQLPDPVATSIFREHFDRMTAGTDIVLHLRFRPTKQLAETVSDSRLPSCGYPFSRGQAEDSNLVWVPGDHPTAIRLALFPNPGQKSRPDLLQDARGYSVGAVLGSMAELVGRNAGLMIDAAGTTEQTIRKLMLGRIDFMLLDADLARAVSKKLELDLPEPVLTVPPIIVGTACNRLMTAEQQDRFQKVFTNYGKQIQWRWFMPPPALTPESGTP